MKSIYTLAAMAIVALLFTTDAFAQRALRGTQVILDDNGVGAAYNTITLTPPNAATLTANYSLTLPVGAPGTGNTGLLLTNATGTMSFLNSSTADNGSNLQVIAGVPAWVSPTADLTRWSTTGNTGLTANTNNFMGTLDATAVNFVTGGVANVRMSLDGTTGLLTVSNGLLVAGTGTANNTATLGNAANAGTFTLSDGSTNTGSVVTGALAANHTFTLPNIGAADANAQITTATSQGTAGQVLVSAGANLPAVWTTSLANTLVRGVEPVVNGQISYTIIPGPAVSATSTVGVAFVTEVGGGAVVSAVTPGAAGVGSFTVTLPAPADADAIAPDDIAIHWTFIP